jgi:hypothetical protein
MKIFKHFGGTNPIPDQKRKKRKSLENPEGDVYNGV